MTPKQIKRELKDAKIKNIDIAIEAKVSPAAVSQVINKKSVSYRLSKIISEKINKTVDVVFPEEFA